ncbi:MAG: hypothetical protein WCA19_20285 [Candidatus Acidiferrales bacterium]
MFNHPPFFFVFFAAMWVSVLYLIAMVSGWYELSKRFRFKGKFYGESLPFRSARMRFYVHFGNSLTVGADQSGLYLAVFPIFRIGHPHLLIPWSEVVVISGETGLIFKKRELRLGRQESIPLRISTSLVKTLRQSAGGAWPLESVGI